MPHFIQVKTVAYLLDPACNHCGRFHIFFVDYTQDSALCAAPCDRLIARGSNSGFGFVPWTHPHIIVKKQVTNFDPDTGKISFVDGSHLDDIDYVIFGRGYTFSLPYLPNVQVKIKRANRRLPGVYQHTWNIDDPSLTFVGMLGGGFTFRVYEWQAVAIARHLSGRAKALPSIKKQKEWESKRVIALGGGKSYYSIAPNYEECFEFPRDIAGDPLPGITGLNLLPFDERWLELWAGMVVPKIQAWKRARKRRRV